MAEARTDDDDAVECQNSSSSLIATPLYTIGVLHREKGSQPSRRTSMRTDAGCHPPQPEPRALQAHNHREISNKLSQPRPQKNYILTCRISYLSSQKTSSFWKVPPCAILWNSMSNTIRHHQTSIGRWVLRLVTNRVTRGGGQGDRRAGRRRCVSCSAEQNSPHLPQAVERALPRCQGPGSTRSQGTKRSEGCSILTRLSSF